MTYLQVLQVVLGACTVVLVYVYLIFPLVMGLLGNRIPKLSRGESKRVTDLPQVSLIIPAYNEEAIIERKIYNALKLDYPQNLLEIIIACDGVTDATVEVANGFRSDHLRVLDFASRRGKACVLNDAISESKGQVLFLCDANVMFTPDVLQKMLLHLENQDVGAVSGDVRLDSINSSFGSGESLYYWMERSIHRGETFLGSMIGVDGGMYIMRRELFRPLKKDTILDDFTISMCVIQQQKQVKYEPAAIASENATESAVTEFSRRVRLSSGAAQVLLRHHFPSVNQPVEFLTFISHKFLRWVSPFILLACVILLSILVVHNSFYQVVSYVLFFLVALAIAGAISKRLRANVLFAVPFYFAMSQTAMAYGMCKGLICTYDAKWERTERQVSK